MGSRLSEILDLRTVAGPARSLAVAAGFGVLSLLLSLTGYRAALASNGNAGAGSNTQCKVRVSTTGLCRIDARTISTLGASNAADPRTLRLLHNGVEVPIYVRGQDDGSLDATDFVLFYATESTSRFSTETTYFLTWGGSTGRRVTEVAASPSGGTPVAATFLATTRIEQDSFYLGKVPQGATDDHWFDGYWAAPDIGWWTLNVSAVVGTSSNCFFRYRVLGMTAIAGVDPDHHLILLLNGQVADDVLWDGQRFYEREVALPQDVWLQNGPNAIGMEAPGDTGASVETFCPDWIEVAYWRDYVATGDKLVFSPDSGLLPGAMEYRLGGFGSPEVEIWEVSDPSSPVRFTSAAAVGAATPYEIRFEDLVPGTSTLYVATALSVIPAPDSVAIDNPSTLSDATNQADYVAIAPATFHAALQPLLQHREAHGLSVLLADIEDVYDEFAYGQRDPLAIRAFLSHACLGWAASPTYALLVGDASYDYCDNLGQGQHNHVPTQLLQTLHNGDTASDNWFASDSGNAPVPTLAVGRIPARSVTDVEVVVQKILSYEQGALAPWAAAAVVVADDGFETEAGEIQSRFGSNVVVARVDVRDYPSAATDPTPVTDDLRTRLNVGTAFLAFVGHGGVENWTHEGIWWADDVGSLQNDNRLPFVLALTCLSGYFDHAEVPQCMAERFLLEPDRGSIACLAGTRALGGYESMVIGNLFCDELLTNGNPPIGLAMVEAKRRVFSSHPGMEEGIQMFTLFGDPALRLKVQVAGDVDFSRRVDGIDLIRFGRLRDTDPRLPTWDARLDINRDGVVNGDDLQLLLRNFGRR
ncbi:C25 family cysteine peptidase [Planctomycetota bacterium]